MNVIVETDIGHDPDDYFALCYLHAAGANIRAIVVHKGEPHQIALVKMFCKEVGLDIPIGATLLNVPEPKEYTGTFEGRPVKEYVGFHHDLLKKYGYSHFERVEDFGHSVLSDVHYEYPDSEIFIIGAPANTGEYIARRHFDMRARDGDIQGVTFQGGFMGYDAHNIPCERLPKFEGKLTCPSYNPNGAVDDTQLIVRCRDIKRLRFVSKNVCHTVVYDKKIHEMMKSVPPKDRASEMFIEGMELYLSKHTDKKFHDPTAAVCMLHPEIGQWVRGTIYRENGGWGTRPDPTSNSETIATIDKNKLWQFLLEKK